MNQEDIYELDTNGMDLAAGLKEADIDIDALKERTKEKIRTEEKRSVRSRFHNASTLAKAAVFLGVLAVGTTSAVAATKVLKYIPNQGMEQVTSQTKVLKMPVTSYGKGGYYLRISSMSYDGNTLTMKTETNWRWVALDSDEKEEKEDESFMPDAGVILKNGEERLYCAEEHESHGEVTEIVYKCKVESLKGLVLVLNAYDWDEKAEDYRYFKEAVTIPLDTLTLSDAKEVTDLSELGVTASSEGITLVGIASRENKMQTIDVQAVTNPCDINITGIIDATLLEDEKEIDVINPRGFYGSREYLLFHAKEEAQKTLVIRTVAAELKWPATLTARLPEPGGKAEINQEYECNGIRLRINSLTISSLKQYDEESDPVYVADLECELESKDGERYHVGEKSYVNAKLSYKGKESSGYGHMDKKTTIHLNIPKEEFMAGEEIKISIAGINEMQIDGEWKMVFRK